MPNLGDSTEQQSAISTGKLLLLGDTKSGKTDWAMRAAEFGFNVLYLDGDVALQTIKDKKRGLDQAALSRTNYMDIRDRQDKDGNYESTMAKFFVDFATSGVLTWNDSKGEMFNKANYVVDFETNTPEGVQSKAIGGDSVWQIRPAKLDWRDVLILDSWTTLVTSLQMWKAADLGIDILEIEKMERDMYTGTAHKATQFLTLLRALRCHVIVIGHPREYQKKSPPPGSKGQVAEKEMKLDWTKMVPVSTSNPHSLTMGKNFSDIAWIDVTGGRNRKIDFRVGTDRIGGGHLGEYVDLDSFTFADYVDSIGGDLPPDGNNPDRWLTRYGPGQYAPAGAKPAMILKGSTAAAARPVSGLSALMLTKPK